MLLDLHEHCHFHFQPEMLSPSGYCCHYAVLYLPALDGVFETTLPFVFELGHQHLCPTVVKEFDDLLTDADSWLLENVEQIFIFHREVHGQLIVHFLLGKVYVPRPCNSL